MNRVPTIPQSPIRTTQSGASASDIPQSALRTPQSKVLIVDDEKSIRCTLSEFLRAEGYEVAEAEDANTALQQLNETDFDVVVTDIILPRVTGVELLRRIRAITPHVQVVLMTGEPTVETASEALRAGAADYLFKPINKAAILRVVANAVRLKTLGDAKRQLEAENLAHQENLERLVDERTRQLRSSEARTRELNRLLQASRKINELIIRERDPQRLFDEACLILTQTCGFRLVWIGLVEPDSKRVCPAARAGEGLDYLDKVVITWDETPTGQGPVGTAVRTCQPWVCQNTATDPNFAPWREAALARGYASVAAVPMVHGTRVIGALSFYADHPEAFDPEELSLLVEVAGDLAFALTSIENERQRSQAEQALQRNQQLLQSVLDVLPVGVWFLDRNRRVQLANPADQAIWAGNCPVEARSSSEFRTWWTAFQERVLREEWAVVRALYLGETKLEESHEVVGFDGRKRTILHSAVPLVANEGGMLGAISVNQDITEKKQLEAQFLRAQRLEAVGTLASGIAHDLNNLLAPILMAAPMLRWKESEADFDKVVSTIESSAHRAAQVIKQVLTFGRGTEGERVAVQLRHLLREVAQIAQETFPRSVKIVTNIPQYLWVVTGDPTQLHQVLLNLGVNARDAMPQGGTLTLGANHARLEAASPKSTGLAPPGPYVVLEVKDTGHGIPAEILDRIFDPFFTTKPLGKGTGLGLPSVVGIVRSHRGFVDVKSEVGRGTTFEVYLPAQPEGQPAPGSAPLPANPRGKAELILVVDDEAPIRETLELALVAQGYRVLTARDGAEGLSMFGQHRRAIAAVVTDLMMPNSDGATLIRALRAADPSLPILASTGLESCAEPGETLAEVLGLGVAAVLRKPYVSSELLSALERALENRRALKGTA